MSAGTGICWTRSDECWLSSRLCAKFGLVRIGFRFKEPFAHRVPPCRARAGRGRAPFARLASARGGAVRGQRAAAAGGSGKCVVSARRGYRGPRRCVLRAGNGPDRFAFVPRVAVGVPRSGPRPDPGSSGPNGRALRPAYVPLGARRSGVTGTRAVNRKVVTRCETTPEVEVPASRRVEDRAIR